MSFARMLDREVTIVRRVVTGSDGRGNDVIGDGSSFTARAMRELTTADEDEDQRDQQERIYRYSIEPRDPDPDAGGELRVITGYDRLVDDGETFEILGTPEYVRQRRRRVHHVELRARRFGAVADGVVP